MIHITYIMDIKYTYSLYEPCLQNSKYWIDYIENTEGFFDITDDDIDKEVNNCDTGLSNACYYGHLDIAKLMLEKGAIFTLNEDYSRHLDIVKLLLEKGADSLPEYKILFKIPKDDEIIEIIYASLYDYMPDEMINEVLKYSIVEDFNLQKYITI